MRSNETPQAVLQKYWGYDDFRPLQREIIEHVLSGRDTLGLLPTGGGKSLCYQVPALILDGVCLVITPLIALMQDQVERLKERGVKAEAIYAGMPARSIDRILDNCVFGDVRLLYLSPERLQTDLAQERIRRMQVSLIAVDEAHCISQWGHDFRPAYLEIGALRTWQPAAPILAVTASATPAVQSDILSQLAMPDAAVVRGGFARDNLSYLVYHREDKPRRLVEIVRQTPGSGLIYVRSRRKTRELSEILVQAGLKAEPYHAGMPFAGRAAVQQRWLEGTLPVIVCTTAFGMGIDKPDVRLVVHYDLPGSMEEYYQEAGRAGRDGKPAWCVMLYHTSDVHQLRSRWSDQYPDVGTMTRVYQALMSYGKLPPGSGQGAVLPVDISGFATTYGLPVPQAYHGLKGLERAGWIVLNEALHHPPRVQFVMSKDALYAYQVARPEFDPLIKVLLRSYEGLFLEPVPIRPGALSRRLGQPEDAVDQQLRVLAREQVIRYEPASDSPRVVVLRERVQPENLDLDQGAVAQLREMAQARLAGMLTFLQEDTCRQQALFRYFGDNPGPACGRCDLCRSGQAEISIEEVFNRIPDAGIGLRTLLNSFPASQAEDVKEHLTSLEAEEKIRIRDTHILRVQPLRL